MVIKFRGRNVPENYEELCEMWESYYIENNRYPNSVTCQKDFTLPSWVKVKSICGDKYEEFCNMYNINKKPQIKDYQLYCNNILYLAKKLNKTPSIEELKLCDDWIPTYKWLIENCPDKRITSYNEFMTYLGLKPHYKISKEMAINIILNMKEKLDRNLMYDDFRNPSYDEIGMATINNIWGTFNNMMVELGFPINQENMIAKNKSLEESINDVTYICNDILQNEGNRPISYEDIDNYNEFNSSQTYNKIFKEELNMTLCEFIISIGFEANPVGKGMNYIFDDGEIATSRYEYQVSNYLNENKIKYIRNVKYSDFINNYDRNKDCDYKITINNEVWYVEIAGMLRDYKSIEHAQSCKLDKIHKTYLSNLIEKESMLKQANVNYKILFPNDLKKLDEAFSFLFSFN